MTSLYAIGADLGGTLLKAGAVARDGAAAHAATRPSRAGGGEDGPFDAVAEAVATIRARAGGTPAALGLAVPGAIEPETGALIGHTPHLPAWHDLEVRQRLVARLEGEGMRGPSGGPFPVTVANDANAAAYAEYRCGAARDTRVSITVTIGTGVGSGIIVDGRPFTGAWGGAGEIGHLSLGSGGFPCRCGVENCVEPDMSGSGLMRAATAAGLDAADAEATFALAARGDPTAAALVTRFADRLGAAIAVAVNVLNPEIVVIGGGVAGAGDVLLDGVREALDRYALASHRRRLRVTFAALGPRAGLIGAGLMAWESIQS